MDSKRKIKKFSTKYKFMHLSVFKNIHDYDLGDIQHLVPVKCLGTGRNMVAEVNKFVGINQQKKATVVSCRSKKFGRARRGIVSGFF